MARARPLHRLCTVDDRLKLENSDTYLPQGDGLHPSPFLFMLYSREDRFMQDTFFHRYEKTRFELYNIIVLIPDNLNSAQENVQCNFKTRPIFSPSSFQL